MVKKNDTDVELILGPREYLENLVARGIHLEDQILKCLELIDSKKMEVVDSKEVNVGADELGSNVENLELWEAEDFRDYLGVLAEGVNNFFGIEPQVQLVNTDVHIAEVFSDQKYGVMPVLCFQNMRIRGQVEFRNIRFPMSIAFVNVHLDSVRFIECAFDKHLTLQKVRAAYCVFYICHVDSITFYSGNILGAFCFDHSLASKDVNFHIEAVNTVVIRGCKFYQSFALCYVQCSELTEFLDNHFMGDATFQGSIFKGPTHFQNEKFTGTVRFDDVEFAGDVNFTGSHFTNVVLFWSAVFAKDSIFDGVIFQYGAEFNNVKFINRTSFQSVKFELPADFSSAFFGKVPKFHDAKLHPGSVFFKTEFPAASVGKFSGREQDYESYLRRRHEDQHAFRALKLLMAGHRNQHLEAKFFADELRVQRETEYTPHLKKDRRRYGQPVAWLLSWLYEKMSMYGQSIERAFFSFFIINFLFAALFFSIDSWAHKVWDWQICPYKCLGIPRNVEIFVTPKDPDKRNKFLEVASPPIALAVHNTVNPLGIFSEKPMVTSQTAWVYFLSILQSILSLASVTLLLFALKSRFQKGSGGGSS